MSERLVWHDKEILDIIDLLLKCGNRDEIRNIFDRVLTPREINDIGRRYKALSLIDEGKSYVDIRLETGMSPVTISRLGSKCGFGFEKSSGLKTQKKVTKNQNSRKTLKYKGVKVVG